MQLDPTRRQALGRIAGALALGAAPAQAECPPDPLAICNVTHLHTVRVAQVQPVHDAQDVRAALRRWPGELCVGGGRYSMGGQTAVAGGLQLDMRGMNRLLRLEPARRVARVQAGMRWRELQAAIDPHGLAVRTMQSYSNFTVGGSVSVNCHGRYVGHGPISGSVRALQIVLPDGAIVEASRTKHADLFHAAIGGYGGVGVLTEVELELDDNFKIERSTAYVALEDYPAWFAANIQARPQVLLHNADLSAPGFDQPHCVTWARSDKPLTLADRLTAPGASYTTEKLFIWAMTELPGGAALRRTVATPLEDRPAVVWRNFEASLDAAELEPWSRNRSTYVLQEYFVPQRQFAAYARQLAKLMQQVDSGTLNISIRHASADPRVLMSWAREDVFCFVVYYKQQLSAPAQAFVGQWTRAMIDLALRHEGTYYLPYQLHATQAQFEQAYPRAAQLRRLRKQLGATRLTNSLWSRYSV